MSAAGNGRRVSGAASKKGGRVAGGARRQHYITHETMSGFHMRSRTHAHAHT